MNLIVRFFSVLDSKVVKQIILLCHILPPKGRLIVKKKHWKFSIQECIDSIIIHATVSIIKNYQKLQKRIFASRVISEIDIFFLVFKLQNLILILQKFYFIAKFYFTVKY